MKLKEEKNTVISHTKLGLLDNATNSFIDADTWIATELERLARDQHPRNCINYESLLFVVEKLSAFNAISSLPYRNNGKKERSIALLLKHRSDKKCDLNRNAAENTAFNTVNKDLLTHRNLISSYLRLITHCQNRSPQHYLYHNRRPIALLSEMEKIKELMMEGTVDGINHIKENLSRIVFGKKIPISRNLVSAWAVICLWVQQGLSTVNSTKTLKNEDWFYFGATAYLIAKKLSDC